MAENITSPTDFKEAVCLDVGRVYDSCCDRDCLEDLRCYFSPRGQEVIEQAISVRCKDAEILNVFIDVEPVHFNRGFYACDLTYFFLVKFDVFTAPHCQPIEVQGVCFFEKKCILFGSEGSVRVFSSENGCDETSEQVKQSVNTPKCIAEAVDPVALSCKLARLLQLLLRDKMSAGQHMPSARLGYLCTRLLQSHGTRNTRTLQHY